jgi:hypothetical protein
VEKLVDELQFHLRWLSDAETEFPGRYEWTTKDTPDDEWYEPADSEYDQPETRRHYEITYYRPAPNKIPAPKPDSPISDTTYIRWEDNAGTQGYIHRNTYHLQDYYPKWIAADKLSF